LEGGQQDRENLVQQVAKCLYSDGRYDQAGALFKEALGEKSKRLKNDDEEVLNSMEWMASNYRRQGRWMEAEKLCVQVIETSKTILRPEHPDTLTSMNNLALTIRDHGR
jgi:tetratricopeptide (TPR) repeat protein